MSSKTYNNMSDSEKQKEDWMNSKWRPMMGWMYMAVCTCDFIVFPVLWSVIQAIGGGQVHTQWNPITLQGAGLFHMAMGAILGIAAWSRGQEKMAGANNGGAMMPTNGGFNNGGFNNSGFNNSRSGSFNSGSSSMPMRSPAAPKFNSNAQVGMSSSGRAMPILDDDEPL